MPNAVEAVSLTLAERARKSYNAIYQRLSAYGAGVGAATSVGVSETTVNRFKNEHLEQFCMILAHLELKVVPSEYQCFNPQRIDALLVLSKAHLETIENASQLSFD